jgi:hypothetical protein
LKFGWISNISLAPQYSKKAFYGAGQNKLFMEEWNFGMLEYWK